MIGAVVGLLGLVACAGPAPDGDASTLDVDSGQDAPFDAATAGCGPSIRVPVRVHLMDSSVPSLDADWTPADAREHLRAAAAFWARHCIDLVEESVVTTAADPAGERAFAEATASAPVDQRRLRAALSDAVPREALLTPGWNVFVIHDFAAPALGVFVPDLGVQSIFVAQQRVDGTPLGTFVLPHEFGHSFSLAHHVDADRERNLMRDDPHFLVEPVLLTAEQAEAARAQARTGTPR